MDEVDARRHRHARRQLEAANLDRLLLAEIADRREDPLLEQRDDVLSLLLKARHEDVSPMTDTELRDELMTLLLAGHETTATAVSWAIERLLRHPDKFERLRSGDEEYLDAVTKETLRLRPVLPIVARKLVEPMEIGGHELPAGVVVAPCIYLVHRRADVYPEPRAFRPERFLQTPPGTYTWIPFGGGVRRCLGAAFAEMEMRIALREILRRRSLRPASPVAERVARRRPCGVARIASAWGAEVFAASTSAACTASVSSYESSPGAQPPAGASATTVRARLREASCSAT